MHGYELMKTFDLQEVCEWAEVSRPHVYYELKRLAERGLIVAERDPLPAAERSRTVYRVTEEGSATLRESLSDERWSRVKRPPPFATWLGLSIHASVEAQQAIIADRIGFLREEIDRKEEALRFIEGYASERAPLGRWIVELYLQQTKFEIEWLSSILARFVQEP